MKKIVILVCLSIGSILFGGEAHELATELNYLESYKQGIQIAKKEHTFMMLVVVEDGCHWCKKFKRTTLSDEDVQKDLHNVVTVMLDRYDDMPTCYESEFFPMVYFINPQTEKPLETSYGYKTKELFTQKLQKAKNELRSKKQ